MEPYFGEIEQAHSRLARERVLADFMTLARDAEDLLKATAHDASQTARAARSRLSAALDRAKVTIAVLQEQAVATAKLAAGKTDIVIRGHSHECIGVTFAVGLLIGVLVIRSARHRR